MPANSHTQTSSDENSVLASIFTQNTHSIEPIRELLTHNGCSVLINETTSQPPDYLICCGDSTYVKDIFSKRRSYTKRAMAIIWNTYSTDVQIILEHADKIIFVNPPPFEKHTVTSIFSFFFTSGPIVKHIETIQEVQPGIESKIDHTIHQTVSVEAKHDTDGNTTISEETEYKPEQKMPAYTVPTVVPKENPVSRAHKIPRLSDNKPLNDSDKERISLTLKEVFGETKIEKEEVIQKKKRKRKIPIFSIFIFCFACCFVPIFWYVVSMCLSLATLAISGITLSEGKIPISKQSSVISLYWTKQARATLRLIGVPFVLVNKKHILRRQEQVLSFLQDTGDALNGACDVIDIGKEFSKTLASQLTGSQGVTLSPSKLVTSLSVQLPYIHDRLGLAYAELHYLVSENAFPFSIPFINAKSSTVSLLLQTARNNISVIEQLLNVYREAGGFDGKKTYLLLLQNSMELRPTGGFIGSIAKMTVHEGLIVSLEIQDVYTVDGQLKGHVDPPKPIQEILGQEHWYLRDSNWNPDFTVSGPLASWFYEKETNVSVDGVFAISTPLLIDLLKVTGPIELPDYSDRITAENFFGKSLYYVQNDFFPGSTQKRDFLGSLTQALIQKITQQQSINAVLLFRAIENALERHDIQMVFINPSLTSLVSQYGWSGNSVTEQSCNIGSTTRCIGDFLEMNEANLSVNKTNAFITREKTSEIILHDDGSATTTTSLSITNSSDIKSTDGGGVYRNYLRFFIPKGSEVVDVSIDGTPVAVRNAKAKTIPNFPFMETISELVEANGKSIAVLPVVFEVQPKTTIHILCTYRYTLPTISQGETVVYEFLQPKQAGIVSIPTETRIRFPGDWKLVSEREPDRRALLANQTQLEYNSLLSRDEIIRILITKP